MILLEMISSKIVSQINEVVSLHYYVFLLLNFGK